jgi:hypothetical protein
MRNKLVAVIAIVGAVLAGTSVAAVGIGAFAASPNSAAQAPPATPKPSQPVDEMLTDEPDTYEEALDRPADPLVSKPKAVTDTDAERAAYGDIENDCMWGKGYTWWDARDQFPHPEPVEAWGQWWTAGKSVEEIEAVNFALFGETGGGADYRWEQAGCHGYATHVTGNDGNH